MMERKMMGSIILIRMEWMRIYIVPYELISSLQSRKGYLQAQKYN